MDTKNREIPPLAFIIIGFIVGVSSIFINRSSESNFLLFVITGFVMAGYGIIKYVLSNKVVNSDSKVSNSNHKINGKNQAHHQAQHHNKNHHIQQQHGNAHTMNTEQKNNPFLFCPNCGGRLPGKVNFCPHCGARLN